MGIYYTDLNYESPERFDLGTFLQFNQDNYDILNSFFLHDFLKLPIVGTYVVQKEEKAPDYLSVNIYGRHEYWWLIMLYNNIFDYRHILTGMVIKYFSINDLESLVYKLRSTEVLNNTTLASTTNNTNTGVTNMSDKNYVHTQIIASIVWTVNHPLKKKPSYTILIKNSDGDLESAEASVIYPSGFETSRLIIKFKNPQRGQVILN